LLLIKGTRKSVVMVNVHVNNKNHGVDVHERENKCVERTAKLTTMNVWRNVGMLLIINQLIMYSWCAMTSLVQHS